MKQLAIVIPAYKATFLDAALASVAAQTCKDFTLYVGDDCSPHDLGGIVSRYRDKIDLVYKRFDSNLGGKDLVAQWERCIDMTQGEPWLWLFSDDDVMETRCVEEFYKAQKATNSKYDVYHFNVKVIGEDGGVVKVPNEYPNVLNNFDFYKSKISGCYVSLVVENVFSRCIYERTQGFVKFDLAWGSDTATWIAFSEEQGFYTIQKTFVLWRSSGQNITPNMSPEIVKRKVDALLCFFEWTFCYFQRNRLGCFLVNSRGLINRLRHFQQSMPDKDLRDAVGRFCRTHHSMLLYPLFITLIKQKRC